MKKCDVGYWRWLVVVCYAVLRCFASTDAYPVYFAFLLAGGLLSGIYILIESGRWLGGASAFVLFFLAGMWFVYRGWCEDEELLTEVEE